MCETVNDIVFTLVQSRSPRCIFGWSDDDLRDVLMRKRPTPSPNMYPRRNDNVKFGNDMYKTYKWLCGSYFYNGLFCWPCLLLGNTHTRWNLGGFSDLEHVNCAFAHHANSFDHIACVEELERLRRSINPDYSSSPPPSPLPPPSSPLPSSIPSPLALPTHRQYKNIYVRYNVSVRANDIVCKLLQKPFIQWSDKDKADVLSRGRPIPLLDFSVDVKRIEKSSNVEFLTGWYKKRKWLCGSAYYQSLYCWPCLLLGSTRTKWDFARFNGSGHMDRAFTLHANAVDHIRCVEELKNLRRSINPDYFSSTFSSSSLCSNVSEPVNDIVCNLLGNHFYKWDFRGRADVLAHGRPTPILDLSDKEEMPELGIFNTINFRCSWYDEYLWLCASFYMQRLFCWPCLLLGNQRTEWNVSGICDLKNINSLAKVHSKSVDHYESVARLKNLHSRFKREIEDCIKQQDTDNSLECRKNVESSSKVSEQPSRRDSDKDNNTFEMDNASDRAYQCRVPKVFKTFKRAVKGCIKQRGLVKSLEGREDAGSSSEVAEQPALVASGMHNNSCEMDNASGSAYQSGLPEELKNNTQLLNRLSPVAIKQEPHDPGDEEQGTQLLNGFSPVPVKAEPTDQEDQMEIPQISCPPGGSSVNGCTLLRADTNTPLETPATSDESAKLKNGAKGFDIFTEWDEEDDQTEQLMSAVELKPIKKEEDEELCVEQPEFILVEEEDRYDVVNVLEGSPGSSHSGLKDTPNSRLLFEIEVAEPVNGKVQVCIGTGTETYNKTKKLPKTVAERQRECRARKKAMKIKKVPKMPIELSRAWRFTCSRSSRKRNNKLIHNLGFNK